jgi:hypothetical protein
MRYQLLFYQRSLEYSEMTKNSSSVKDKVVNDKDFNKEFDDALTRREKELNKIGKWGIDYEKRQKEKRSKKNATNNDANNKDNDDNNEKPDSASILLAELKQKGDDLFQLFVDKQGVAFCASEIDDHRETLAIKSSRFRRWICKKYFESNSKPIKGETLKQITDLLEAQALFSKNVKDLRLRTSSSDDEIISINSDGTKTKVIHYDLTNPLWQAVRITPTGWGVEESYDVPVIFRRHSNQVAQVIPSREYPKDIFDQFMDLINVKDDDNKLLLKCYIIALFIPDIPKAVLMLHGEQGSAKSTLQELIKRLVDPSSIISLTFPRDINELVQQLSHNYVAYYDNVSFIRDWISDQICRAVTGSGFSKRELYSDDDDIIYNFKRCIGINGINLAASKADLLDRSIIIVLERIAKENRRKIQEILLELESIKPMLLGYIFDVISKVLKVVTSGGIDLDSKSRMADFEEYCEIISRCMGYEDFAFIEAYRENQKLQTDAVIEGSPVALAVVRLMEQNNYDDWAGTATDLSRDLESVADGISINTSNKGFPKSPSALIRRLNEVRTSLRETGILIEYTKSSDLKRSRIIKIRKMSSIASIASKKEDLSVNKRENLDDINNSSDDTSKMSSSNIVQNRAQNQELDGMDGMDDNIQTLQKQVTILNSRGMKFYSGSWHCEHCNTKGDKFSMLDHKCNGKAGRSMK